MSASPGAGVSTQPELDAELGEVMTEGEQAAALAIARTIRQNLERAYPPSQRPARRDAHPKAHGCVRATFRVEEHLPPQLAQGAFVPGKVYPAWVRFSNGDGDPKRSDAEGDVRGMAIKLLDVPGEKLLSEDKDARTLDFVIMRRKIVSPLETRYWSATAYRLGIGEHKLAIKFSAKPCLVPSATRPDKPGPHFLREVMAEQLRARAFQFDFLVQPRTSREMDVERSTVEWRESKAPFHKVATITIPQQTFSTTAQDAFGENLSFTPWHALPEHRPLGAVNRVRRVVYEEMSRARHEMNASARREPVGDETFDG